VYARTEKLVDDIYLCESLVVQLGMGDKTAPSARNAKRTEDTESIGIQLLRLLDQVADELEQLEHSGVDVRAEQGRFESLLDQLRNRARALVASTGAEIQAQRPSEARCWWYLDEKIAADRKRTYARVAGFALVGLAVVLILTYLIGRILASPTPASQSYAHRLLGQQSAIDGDLAGAIEQFEAAAEIDPDDADAHLWLGVLYETAGHIDAASSAFERAQALLGSGPTFFLERGLLYLNINESDAASKDAEAAVKIAPGQPEGYYLQGLVAEWRGDLEHAVTFFEKASELAESTDQPQLQLLARMRFGAVLERLRSRPDE
jgi:tetratricopeptide (TPR) repeat protein